VHVVLLSLRLAVGLEFKIYVLCIVGAGLQRRLETGNRIVA
jgi:hypothetical protein